MQGDTPTSQLAQEKVKNRAPPKLKADQPAIWVILSFTCKYMFKEFFCKGSNKTGKKILKPCWQSKLSKANHKIGTFAHLSHHGKWSIFWAKDGIREQFLAGNKCLGCVRETSSKNGPRYLGWWIIMSFCHLPSILFGKQNVHILLGRPMATTSCHEWRVYHFVSKPFVWGCIPWQIWTFFLHWLSSGDHRP